MPRPPPGPCAAAHPPAISTPANAKTNLPLVAPRISLSFSVFPKVHSALFLLLVAIAVHELGERLHRRRHLARYIAINRSQQILVRFTGALLGCQLLFPGQVKLRSLPGHYQPMMMFVKPATQASRRQYAAKSPSNRQPPAPMRCHPHSGPRPAVCRVTPRTNALPEVSKGLFERRIEPLFQNRSGRLAPHFLV
jgi:hypothetical protein